jgi:hypothetical protein
MSEERRNMSGLTRNAPSNFTKKAYPKEVIALSTVGEKKYSRQKPGSNIRTARQSSSIHSGLPL